MNGNLKNAKRLDGVFTCSEQAYFNCIELKKGELDELLAKDEAFWSEERDRTRLEAVLMKEQLEALMQECHGKLSAILSRREAPKLGYRCVLKKLPVWGYPAQAHEITFEWPTPFDLMNQDVSLASIKLKD